MRRALKWVGLTLGALLILVLAVAAWSVNTQSGARAIARLAVSALGIMKTAQMDVGFSVDPLLVIGVMVGAIVLTIATGALTTWSALSTKPAQYLRALG